MTPLIRVSIVEDDREVREGLTWLFRHAPGFKRLDACASGEDALATFPRHQPDVVLLDIHLPGRSGIDCLPQLKQRCPTTQVGILTVFEDDDLIFGALMAGATGYLLKKTPPGAILEAVRDLHAGGSPMSSQIARRLVRALADQPDLRFRAAEGPVGVSSTAPAAELCARERQILDLLAQGFRSGSVRDVASPAASAFGCPFARAGLAVAGDHLTTHIFMRIPKFGALGFPGDA